ncbi:MAG: hypothetical protein EOL98_01295 [Negativicutes bacterium]|nr:hypothetical protein [Negativicutes bacterium]
MIRIPDKSHFYSFERIMFPAVKDINNSRTDVTRYMRFKEEVNVFKNGIEDVDSTLITDLRLTDDKIMQQFSQTVRYEIKRSLTDEITMFFYTYKDLAKIFGIVEDFKNTFMNYCDICNKQSLKKVYDEEKIRSYIDNECVLLSKAAFSHGKVFHLYVFDENDALLVYSASDYRNGEIDRSLAGRANKLLHYNDMLYLKSQGLSYYDWGNVASFESPNGIDKFKISFGGTRTKVYSYFVGNSLLGKFLVFSKKMLQR